jgi:hypothetical protein
MSRTIKERILAKTDKNGEGGCWNWTGAMTSGVPKMKVQGKTIPVARLMWAMARNDGRIPGPEINIIRKCNNPTCISPNHLISRKRINIPRH